MRAANWDYRGPQCWALEGTGDHILASVAALPWVMNVTDLNAEEKERFVAAAAYPHGMCRVVVGP